MMLSQWEGDVATPLRHELGFDGRVARRFASRPRGMNDMLREAAATRPDDDALVFEGDRWSWRELSNAAARLGGGLRSIGVEPGDRVAVLTENNANFVIAAYATWHIGAILVPVSAREQRPGVAHALNDSGAKILLFHADLAAQVPDPDDEGAVRHSIEFGSAAYQALFAQAVAAEADAEEAFAAILYTSGTTGKPKGVTLSHGAIVHSAINYVETMQLGPSDRSIVAVPFSHVTGLVALLATALRAQAALIVQRSFSARSFLDTAERERMTHTVMVPAMYNLCLLIDDFAQRNLSAWRVAGFGGAPMALPTIEKLCAAAPRLRLMNLYGATETTSPAVIMPPEFAIARLESVGRAVPGCEILVMDADGVEVAAGEIGELWMRGPMVTRGYWGGGALQEFADGFWRSGDLGSIDADGFVTLHGRSKEVINRGGYKIFPAEVESALTGFPGVIEAAVVARRCTVLGQRVHARVVVAADAGVDVEALRMPLAARFSDYKVPETWDIGTEPLPRNANGKVQKRAIEDVLTPYARERS